MYYISVLHGDREFCASAYRTQLGMRREVAFWLGLNPMYVLRGEVTFSVRVEFWPL